MLQNMLYEACTGAVLVAVSDSAYTIYNTLH